MRNKDSIIIIYFFTSQLAHPSNWADEMDAIQSPQDDGFLTLPGQDSKGHSGDRSKSPSPSPSFSLFSSSHVETQPAKHNQHERQQLQQQQREVGSVESVRSVESLPARGRLQQQREAGSVESVQSAESLPPRDRRKERETSRSISPRYTYIVDGFCLHYYPGTEGEKGGRERLRD